MSSTISHLTRTFSLLPDSNDKKNELALIKERMLAFRDLENTYLELLLTSLEEGKLTVSDFSGESKSHIKGHVYNRLKLNQIYKSNPARIIFKERMLRCAIQYPYFAVREWLVRIHYLSLLIKELNELISSSSSHILLFIQGESMPKTVMNRFSRLLHENCFGKTAGLSHEYITNLLGQVRNIFLSSTTLEPLLEARLNEISKNTSLIEDFMEDVLNSFTRKKKGMFKKIPLSGLLEHFFKQYIARVKRKSTWHAKHVLKHEDITEFNRSREINSKALIKELQAFLDDLPGDFIHEFSKKTLLDALDERNMNVQASLLKHVFKPACHAPRVGITPHREEFLTYFASVMKNQVRVKFKELFLTRIILKEIANELTKLENSLHSLVNTPRIRHLALPINQEEGTYTPNFDDLTITLSFISRETFNLKIRDEKERIKGFMERGVMACLPVLTMKGKKLLFHLPLELNSSDLSKQSLNCSEKKKVVIGVDLGLKHLAVLSVMDLSDPRSPLELARYFISMRALLDMKFNGQSGKFESLKRFTNPHSNKKSNQKLKLRNLRREARILQRKLHEYEKHLSKRNDENPKRKYKHYRLTRALSGLWERVHHVNQEVIRQLQHVIMKIARYHDASILKVENLKWSRHSKKNHVGGWLAFWQTHWFFSRVQAGIELQSRVHGIEFRRIKAAYTSQKCWECGEKGTRKGRSFTCTNNARHASRKTIYLHSDLNAARNIALA